MQTNVFIGCAQGANTDAKHRRRGFTRLELFAVLGAIGLLMAIALPALANKARSQQAGCFNNLRQIGRAFQEWASEHEYMFPYSIRQEQGGTALAPNAWAQFGVLSNELGSASLLVCPSDDKKRPAGDFSMKPERGLYHANFRNSAVSYFISHGFWRYPRAPLCGDRNIRVDAGPSSCSQFGNNIWVINPMYATAASWTNNMHINSGNLLHVDGGVDFLDNASLVWMLRNSPTDGNRLHVVIP